MAEIDNYEDLNRIITAESGMPIVTKFLVLAECIDEDGERCVMNITSDHCVQWDQLGLMEFHRQTIAETRPKD